MAQASRIMEILQEMIHIDSETNTPKERQIEQYLQKFFADMDVISGLIHVPNDRCERSVVYGLVLGKSRRTVIFMNHHTSSILKFTAICATRPLIRKN